MLMALMDCYLVGDCGWMLQLLGCALHCPPRGPQRGWATVARVSHLLDDIPFISFLPSSISLPGSPISWNHLLDELLPLTFLSQGTKPKTVWVQGRRWNTHTQAHAHRHTDRHFVSKLQQGQNLAIILGTVSMHVITEFHKRLSFLQRTWKLRHCRGYGKTSLMWWEGCCYE